MTETVLEKYVVTSDKVSGEVEIKRVPNELVPIYFLRLPKIEPGTLAILDKIRELLVTKIPIKSTELLDVSAIEDLKQKFLAFGLDAIKKELPTLPSSTQELLIGLLIQEMLGLGKVEMLLADGELEEIVINTATEPIWAYHKKHGWL
jgi:hypothetical protein